MNHLPVVAPRMPVMGMARNPLIGLTSNDMHPVPVDMPLCELAPKDAVVLMCRYNGEWLLREHWKERTRPGDVIEWFDVPQSKDLLRTILQIAVTIAAMSVGGPMGAAIAIFGNVLVNGLLPPTAPQLNKQDSPSPTYNTSLAGNQARLYQPIPKICGRHRVVPSFASQPYLEYDAQGEQYYYAVLVVGYGNHTVERVEIDDTSITRFADVLVNEYLPPGTQPSTVLANVMTAPEVTNQELKPLQYVGGFAACAPKKLATHIGIDVIAHKGLGKANSSGDFNNITVQWRVEIRDIDQFGRATTPWSVLANESKTAATNKVQRWSFKYDLVTARRVEVRLVRTDVRDESIRALHDIQWAGLRAYLNEPAPLDADTAHYEVVLRASDQLSAMSQRSISIIARAHARTWNPNTGWSAEGETRTPAWWALDCALGAWGLEMNEARVDVESFYDFAQINDMRQDRFDYVFDTAIDGWEALQLIVRAGRGRVFRRNGILSVARDELATLPVTAFTPHNTVPGSMIMSEQLWKERTPDGYVIEYFDNRAWDWLPIECPCPGVTNMTNPIRMRMPGVTGPLHAEREGLYEAAVLLYRTRTTRCITEMEGELPAYLSPVRWLPEIEGYGQSGEVTAWDPDSLMAELSEPPRWGPDPLYITFIRDNGSLTTPILVAPTGSTETRSVVLASDPGFAPSVDIGTRERTRFLLGTLSSCDEVVRVSAITDGGLSEEGVQLIEITATVDDDRVHEVDNHLLPGPGVIQDPVGSGLDVPGGDGGDGDDGGGTLLLPRLLNHNIFGDSLGSGRVQITLRNNGVLNLGATSVIAGFLDQNIAHEWIANSPVELADASLYEVRAVYVSHITHAGGDNYETDILNQGVWGVWQSLDTNRTWEVSTISGATVVWRGILNFDLQIREAATGVVQATARIMMFGSFDGGGA